MGGVTGTSFASWCATSSVAPVVPAGFRVCRELGSGCDRDGERR